MTLIVRDFTKELPGDPTKTTDMDYTRSVSADWDKPRTCICARRSNGQSLLDEPFDSGISAWTPIKTTATAVVDHVNPGDPDPMIGNALNLFTGATLGTTAGAQRVAPGGVIPSTFGMAMLYKLNNAGSDPLNALNVWIQTNAGKLLKLRFYDDAIEANVDGTWQLLFARGGAWFMEAWIMCVDVGGGDHAVSIYLGTQKVGPTLTGALSAGIPGNNNLVAITQQSGTTVNRQSQVAFIGIGTTELPDDMTWCSPKTILPTSPVTANVELWIENVSVSLALNTNLRCFITKNDLTTLTQVTLTDDGAVGGGELDPPKAMRRLVGAATFAAGPGTEFRLVVDTNDGGYFPLQLAVVNIDYP